MAKPTKPISYDALRALLGKPIDDPAMTAMLSRAGKIKKTPDAVVAKDAGFELAFSRPEGAKRTTPKIATTLFLSPEFPSPPLAFTTREQLLATMPQPVETWKIGEFDLPVTTPDADADRWDLDGVEVSAEYRDRAVKMIVVSLPDDQTGGRDLATHPLHFATKPADAPPDAELVGMALLVAWGADRFGLPAKHAGGELGKQLLARKITPRTFLIAACNKTLTTLDFDPKLGGFLYAYTNRISAGDGREQADTAIKKLLHLHRDDERAFTDDFLGTFSKVLSNPFHVPDSWDAVDRLAPVLDARWADYDATKFHQPPPLALYEKAAKLRDQHAVTAARATPAVASADATLAADLIALIGRPLSDAAVKAVLARAGMPVGKKIDEQANPALGVAYMGTKIELAGKRVLGVDAVWFYANKQKSYIRGIGAEVEFVGFPGVLPHELAFGDPRATVIRKLGKPAEADSDADLWYPTKQRRIRCSYTRGKLVEVILANRAMADFWCRINLGSFYATLVRLALPRGRLFRRQPTRGRCDGRCRDPGWLRRRCDQRHGAVRRRRARQRDLCVGGRARLGRRRVVYASVRARHRRMQPTDHDVVDGDRSIELGDV